MKNVKIGIIGGGQLGLLLTQAAIDFPAHISIFDPNENCPAAIFTNHYTKGNFDDYQAILEFGKDKEVLIFETEKANVKALKELQEMGKKILSSPQTLEWIQDKGKQKEKLEAAGIPTSPFHYVAAEEVKNYPGPFPIVQKWRTGGYDGYGVQIHKNRETLSQAEARDSIFEALVDLEKEVSVLVARNEAGDLAIYPPVEMVFDPVANLVDYLLAPANINNKQSEALEGLTKKIAEKLEFIGIYAIEFFIDKKGEIYVNEISPRPHNSGHHTVSANVTSQYEQQIRIALGLPLGSTQQLSPCLMLNLLAENVTGETHYQGLKEAYEISNVQYVLYGKNEVRPSRKMGHALILEQNSAIALEKMKQIKNTLTITTNEQ